MKNPFKSDIGRYVRPLFLLLSFFLGGTGAADAFSLDEVNTSRHNLLPLASSSSSTACPLCHIDGVPWRSSSEKSATVEGAPEPKAPPLPLWVSKGAKPYSLTATLPRERQPYNQPTGSSFSCLACHDGVLGKDMHGVNVGAPRFGAEGALPLEGVVGRLGAPPLSRVDHPISVPYPRRPDGRFDPENPTVTFSRYWAIPDRRPDGFTLPVDHVSSYLDLPAGGNVSRESISTLVRTTSGRVECDSCHNPHSEQVRPFLRVPSASLCLVCHDR